MKKVNVKSYKAGANPKKNLKMLLGVIGLGLVLLAMVLLNINKSQDNQGSAKEKSPEVCGKDEESRVNQKGNSICVKKEKKEEVNGKTGCKGGQVMYRNPDGQNVCMDKCKSGYELGIDRATGNWGCVKEMAPTVRPCGRNQHAVNNKCKCDTNYQFDKWMNCVTIIK